MATIITFSSALFCLFFFFFSFLSLQTMSQPQPTYLSTFCVRSTTFPRTSSYQSNRETVLSSLRESSSLRTYSNATAGLSPNKVHGMFLCRGDITKASCSDCVKTATLEIAKNCTNQKEALIYYEECMVRYSDYSFLTLLEGPYIMKYSLNNFPITSLFEQTLIGKMGKLIPQAASSLLPATPYFVEDKERKNELGGSYTFESMVQCSPDLDPSNCTVCLRLAVQDMVDCCSRSRWAQIFLPKCLVMYNTSAPVTSLGVIKGNNISGRGFIVVITASVLALVGL